MAKDKTLLLQAPWLSALAVMCAMQIAGGAAPEPEEKSFDLTKENALPDAAGLVVGPEGLNVGSETEYSKHVLIGTAWYQPGAGMRVAKAGKTITLDFDLGSAWNSDNQEGSHRSASLLVLRGQELYVLRVMVYTVYTETGEEGEEGEEDIYECDPWVKAELIVRDKDAATQPDPLVLFDTELDNAPEGLEQGDQLKGQLELEFSGPTVTADLTGVEGVSRSASALPNQTTHVGVQLRRPIVESGDGIEPSLSRLSLWVEPDA